MAAPNRRTPQRPGSRVCLGLVLWVLGALVGCASAPPQAPARTTVVLLPDEDGKVGAVTVSNDAGAQQIDQAYGAVTADAAGPSPTRQLQRDAVDSRYGELLKAQPPKPQRFVLYFLLDRAELTDSSKAMLLEVLKSARDRAPTRIAVYGHTDAIGSAERNLKLSAERAVYVAALLRAAEPGQEDITVEYFGERSPLVPSPSDVAQPVNRRVEVTIL